MAERHDGLDDGRRLRALSQALREGPVDLDLVDLEFVQITQLNSPCRNRRAQCGNPPRARSQRIGGRGYFIEQNALRHLELDPPRIAAGFAYDGERPARRSSRSGTAPATALTETKRLGQLRAALTGLAQHPVAERHDQPGLLRDRNELARRNESAHRVPPADQRLDTDDRTTPLRSTAGRPLLARHLSSAQCEARASIIAAH